MTLSPTTATASRAVMKYVIINSEALCLAVQHYIKESVKMQRSQSLPHLQTLQPRFSSTPKGDKLVYAGDLDCLSFVDGEESIGLIHFTFFDDEMRETLQNKEQQVIYNIEPHHADESETAEEGDPDFVDTTSSSEVTHIHEYLQDVWFRAHKDVQVGNLCTAALGIVARTPEVGLHYVCAPVVSRMHYQYIPLEGVPKVYRRDEDDQEVPVVLCEKRERTEPSLVCQPTTSLPLDCREVAFSSSTFTSDKPSDFFFVSKDEALRPRLRTFSPAALSDCDQQGAFPEGNSFYANKLLLSSFISDLPNVRGSSVINKLKKTAAEVNTFSLEACSQELLHPEQWLIETLKHNPDLPAELLRTNLGQQRNPSLHRPFPSLYLHRRTIWDESDDDEMFLPDITHTDVPVGKSADRYLLLDVGETSCNSIGESVIDVRNVGTEQGSHTTSVTVYALVLEIHSARKPCADCVDHFRFLCTDDSANNVVREQFTQALRRYRFTVRDDRVPIYVRVSYTLNRFGTDIARQYPYQTRPLDLRGLREGAILAHHFVSAKQLTHCPFRDCRHEFDSRFYVKVEQIVKSLIHPESYHGGDEETVHRELFTFRAPDPVLTMLDHTCRTERLTRAVSFTSCSVCGAFRVISGMLYPGSLKLEYIRYNSYKLAEDDLTTPGTTPVTTPVTTPKSLSVVDGPIPELEESSADLENSSFTDSMLSASEESALEG
ncbi:Hypp2039 [Branchiostoma lanceolatum]|uniref:Hypp2039 protein n=1 Tax=Branchiostoma lanceolatum TaxID=7740 RepID=A0A8J9ZR41_BRALA|nr:Hypp2039 [Branchiostoma lanceolatum]